MYNLSLTAILKPVHTGLVYFIFIVFVKVKMIFMKLYLSYQGFACALAYMCCSGLVGDLYKGQLFHNMFLS